MAQILDLILGNPDRFPDLHRIADAFQGCFELYATECPPDLRSWASILTPHLPSLQLILDEQYLVFDATILKSDVSPIPMNMGSIPLYERTQLPMLWKLYRPPGRFLAGIISYILSQIVTSQVPQDFVQLHEALVDYVSWVISHRSTLRSLRSFLGLADSTISH